MMIKRIALLLFVIYSMSARAQCNLYPIEFGQKVRSSDLISEAMVISKLAFSYDDGMIFTRYKLKLYSVYKGNPLFDTVTVISQGGFLSDRAQWAEGLPKLEEGNRGLFFVYKGKEGFRFFSGIQGIYLFQTETQKLHAFFDEIEKSELSNKLLLHLPEMKPRILHDDLYPEEMDYPLKSIAVNSIEPDSVNAGLNEEITIRGFGFGANQNLGNLMLRNSNDGGQTLLQVSNLFIRSWSDNQIVARVPSWAGSGTIRVNGPSGSVNSSRRVGVRYAHIKTGDQEALYNPTLISRNTNQGYIIRMNSNFASDTAFSQLFVEAMNQWRCSTQVNWSLRENTSLAGTRADTLNVVSFDDSGQLEEGVLGLCYSYYSSCQTGTWYLTEFDILFRRNANWYTGFDAVPSLRTDFYTVALHELGHAHQLAHVIDPNDLMHFSIPRGVSKRNLNAYNVDGAKRKIEQAQSFVACDRKGISRIPAEVCRDEFWGFYQAMIYPNPATDNLYIEVNFFREGNFEVSLYDLAGRKVFADNYYANNAGRSQFVIHLPSLSLKSGIYLMSVESNNQRIIKKVLHINDN
jgi:hypothetical protein